MPSAQLKIVNSLGLHARAAAKLVGCAKRFESEVELAYGGQAVDGKSIMTVMLLAAPLGSELVLTTTGTDEDDALAELTDLIRRGFDEDVVDD
ncbi:MAG: HPr family phosphocarrier protein [Pseudomonadota bacterium]